GGIEVGGIHLAIRGPVELLFGCQPGEFVTLTVAAQPGAGDAGRENQNEGQYSQSRATSLKSGFCLYRNGSIMIARKPRVFNHSTRHKPKPIQPPHPARSSW